MYCLICLILTQMAFHNDIHALYYLLSIQIETFSLFFDSSNVHVAPCVQMKRRSCLGCSFAVKLENALPSRCPHEAH